jgi:hypothetical protein
MFVEEQGRESRLQKMKNYRKDLLMALVGLQKDHHHQMLIQEVLLLQIQFHRSEVLLIVQRNLQKDLLRALVGLKKDHHQRMRWCRCRSCRKVRLLLRVVERQFQKDHRLHLHYEGHQEVLHD